MTNMPVALAPGMGLNAYFAYQVVGFHGTGPVPYRLALAAVFIEGFIFIFLALIGMRQWLVRLLPTSIKIASAVGIGLFLAEIGLSGSAGIGAISGAVATPLDIAGCPAEFIDPTTGMCTSHQMRSVSVSTTTSNKTSLHALNVLPDVDWYLVWRRSYGILDDVQGKECHDRWHLGCVHHLLAVSISLAKFTHIC
jgi:xanthine/uracil/vitamin C permease (AzgA family)